MEVRRYAPARPAPFAALSPVLRIRSAVAVADTLALTSKSKPVPPQATGLSQLDAAKRAFWPRFAGGAALSAGGLGIMAVGVLGVATLPYAAFAGLFLGGIATIASGVYLAWTGTRGVVDAHAALNHDGLG